VLNSGMRERKAQKTKHNWREITRQKRGKPKLEKGQVAGEPGSMKSEDGKKFLRAWKGKERE